MKHVVIVTGASGFLGRHVCRRLTERGHDVVGVGRRPLDAYDGIAGYVTDWIVSAEVRLPRGATVIAHLAQSTRFREFPDSASDMFDVNLRSTFGLLEAARKAGVSRFVYVSTGGVYERGRSSPPSAPILAQPELGFYPMTKLASELLVRNYEGVFSTAVLRPFFPFGPGQQSDRLVPRLIESVTLGRPLKLQGENGLTINPIYAADAAEVFTRAIEAQSHLTVDIAGRDEVSLRRLGELIGLAVGREALFEVDRAAASASLLGDWQNMIDCLSFTPSISIEDAIARTVASMSMKPI